MFGLSAGAALALGVGGGMVLSSMGDDDAPDTSGMNASAVRQGELSGEQLDFAKQIYADSAPDRAAASKRAGEVSDLQIEGARKSIALADSYDQYNRSTFQPLEREIVADARNFNTEGERERLAGLALGDVQQSAASAREGTARTLGRMGVNPSDGRFAAGLKDVQTATTLAGADAKNKSRMNSITLGNAMKMDAASLGRNLPSQQATQAGLALSQGNSSVGNANVPNQVAAGGAALMNAGYRGAQVGYAGAANTYGNIAGINSRAGDDSGAWNALGTVAGAYLASDKNIKHDRKKVSGEVALSQARKLPGTSTWRYNKGSVADDGGKLHQGPMAQEVQQAMGNKAAPGGKMINLEAMSSVGLAAIKQVDKNQQRIEKRLISLENARPKKA